MQCQRKIKITSDAFLHSSTLAEPATLDSGRHHGEELLRTMQNEIILVGPTAEKDVPVREYLKFQKAFDRLNEFFFSSKLSNVLITLSTHSRLTDSLFIPNRFPSRNGDGKRVHEIRLDPRNFRGRTDLQVASTIYHAMVHQELFEKEGKQPSAYHGKDCGRRMVEVGIVPVPKNGKFTGRGMSYEVFPGKFQAGYALLEWEGFKLDWESEVENIQQESTALRKRKKTYTCPKCLLHAWAKPYVFLICGACDEPMREH